MTFKLWNYIFGWDYIQWSNSADSGVSRVHKSQDGNVYYWRYKGTKVLDIINDGDGVVWLTCRPEKYSRKNETKQLDKQLFDCRQEILTSGLKLIKLEKALEFYASENTYLDNTGNYALCDCIEYECADKDILSFDLIKDSGEIARKAILIANAKGTRSD